MNTCPKCGSQEYAQTPDIRIYFRCDSYGYNDKEKFDLVYRSELCLEREEKNTLQRKVKEFAEDLCVERITHANTIRKLDDKHKEVCELKRERNRLIDAWPVFEAVMGLRKQRDQWRECAEGLAQALWQERPSLEIPSARHSALIEFERLKENSK